MASVSGWRWPITNTGYMDSLVIGSSQREDDSFWISSPDLGSYAGGVKRLDAADLLPHHDVVFRLRSRNSVRASRWDYYALAGASRRYQIPSGQRGRDRAATD